MSKIHINELRERASKGEFTTSKGSFYTYVWSTENGFVCECDIDHDAQLIAHSLNNFFPLLEALEEIRAETLTSGHPVCGEIRAIADEALEKISYTKVDDNEE